MVRLKNGELLRRAVDDYDVFLTGRAQFAAVTSRPGSVQACL
jgi:hypothetical protein